MSADNDPNRSAPQEGGEEETGKSRSWLRVALLVMGLSLGGTAGVFFLGPMVGQKLLAGDGEEGGHGGGGHGGGGASAATMHVIDNLVVNPSGTEGRRFLLISVAMEPADGDTEGLRALEPELRAALIPILASRSVEELLDISHREELMAEVTEALQHILGEGALSRVLFPQFVVQ